VLFNEALLGTSSQKFAAHVAAFSARPLHGAEIIYNSSEILLGKPQLPHPRSVQRAVKVLPVAIFGSRRPSVSWIFAPKTFCLTNQLFGSGATNSVALGELNHRSCDLWYPAPVLVYNQNAEAPVSLRASQKSSSFFSRGNTVCPYNSPSREATVERDTCWRDKSTRRSIASRHTWGVYKDPSGSVPASQY